MMKSRIMQTLPHMKNFQKHTSQPFKSAIIFLKMLIYYQTNEDINYLTMIKAMFIMNSLLLGISTQKKMEN